MPFGDLRVEEALERFFNIEDQYIYYEQIRYIVSIKEHMSSPEEIKEGFHSFIAEIRQYDYLAKFTREDGRYLIIPFKMPREKTPNYNKNIILFAATFITVFYDGYLRSSTRLLTEALMPGVIGFTYRILAISMVISLEKTAVSCGYWIKSNIKMTEPEGRVREFIIIFCVFLSSRFSIVF